MRNSKLFKAVLYVPVVLGLVILSLICLNLLGGI